MLFLVHYPGTNKLLGDETAVLTKNYKIPSSLFSTLKD